MISEEKKKEIKAKVKFAKQANDEAVQRMHDLQAEQKTINEEMLQLMDQLDTAIQNQDIARIKEINYELEDLRNQFRSVTNELEYYYQRHQLTLKTVQTEVKYIIMMYESFN